jgi:hypothetical protein
MLEVIDKNVTEIGGQKLVPMKDTEVRVSATPRIVEANDICRSSPCN